MNISTIVVSGVNAYAGMYTTIPAGIVGAAVTFQFVDPMWDGLTKTVVFQGNVTRDVILRGDTAVVPHETVASAGASLRVGIYGVDTDNNLIIPTLWATIGAIRDAADPSGDPGTDPSLPVWADLQNRVEDLEKRPAGSGIDVSGAAPGQTVKIAAVDDKGRPTAWDPADFPESGGNVDLTGYATEQFVRDGYQPKGDYALHSEIPTVPTNVSAFTNDAGYLTQHQDLSGYAKSNDIPKRVSELENDKEFATEQYVAEEIAKAQLGGNGGSTEIKTRTLTADDLPAVNVYTENQRRDSDIICTEYPITDNFSENDFVFGSDLEGAPNIARLEIYNRILTHGEIMALTCGCNLVTDGSQFN